MLEEKILHNPTLLLTEDKSPVMSHEKGHWPSHSRVMSKPGPTLTATSSALGSRDSLFFLGTIAPCSLKTMIHVSHGI